jgi:hypothetical protein
LAILKKTDPFSLFSSLTPYYFFMIVPFTGSAGQLRVSDAGALRPSLDVFPLRTVSPP